MLFQAVASGITAGSVYSLVALAFVLLYKGTRVVNFGQGEQVMLGAYLVLVLNTFLGLPFGLALVGALALAAVSGVLIQVLVLRRIEGSPALTKIIATLAVGLILREGTRAMLGANAYPFPFLLSPSPIKVGTVLLTPANLAIVVVSLAVMALFYVFFRDARLGKALRAACENRLSGQASIDDDGNVVGKGDMQVQVHTALEAVRRGLALAGATPADVVKVVFYTTDCRAFHKTQPIREASFPKPYPAQTLVEVTRLAMRDFLVEAEVTAVVDD